ncbi:MAG: hypothetical protein H0T46_02730 [Deltaproteobacteria bacterium]|nr:hypothetical protein [Deltaproteobacteria bacterium]
MARQTIILELADNAQFAVDLAAGGIFVPGCALTLNDECDLVVRGPNGELEITARVVYVDPAKGAGLELVGFGPAVKERIATLALEPTLDMEPDPETSVHEVATEDADIADDDDGKPAPKQGTLQDQLRGLSLAQQVRTANSANPATRMALERMYGKAVWEALLRNPRLTAPEVARLARMGTLPRVQIETIVNNGAWLQLPEVRRALLSNPRLGTDQILRVLRLMPKHELKVASTATAYPFAVRDQAKKLLRD